MCPAEERRTNKTTCYSSSDEDAAQFTQLFGFFHVFIYLFIFFNWKIQKEREDGQTTKDDPVVCDCQQRHYYGDL